MASSCSMRWWSARVSWRRTAPSARSTGSRPTARTGRALAVAMPGVELAEGGIGEPIEPLQLEEEGEAAPPPEAAVELN